MLCVNIRRRVSRAHIRRQIAGRDIRCKEFRQRRIGLAPLEFTLSQNYPNPFNPITTIEFTLPQDGHVSLKVHDITGREVATLVDREMPAGVYQRVVFNASRLASGMYFARLQAGGKQLIKTMILVK